MYKQSSNKGLPTNKCSVQLDQIYFKIMVLNWTVLILAQFELIYISNISKINSIFPPINLQDAKTSNKNNLTS